MNAYLIVALVLLVLDLSICAAVILRGAASNLEHVLARDEWERDDELSGRP